MTNNSPLDEHIKEKFGDYSPDVPPHIWENIIAEKEKRRPAGFWFSFLNKNLTILLFGIVIAGAGIIIYKNVHSTEDTKTNAINKPLNTTTDIAVTPENENESITANGNDLKTATSSTETRNNIPAETNAAVTKKIIPAGNTKNDPSTSSANNNKNIFQQSSADKNNSNAKSDRSSKRSKYLKGSASMSYKNPEAISDDVTETSVNTNDLLLNRFLLNLDMIRSQKTFSATVKKTNNPHLDIPCPEAEKNAAGNKRYFEIYGGPDYAFRSITDTGNSAYLQKRKESISFSSAFSAGLRYTRVFSNGMSFRTGINYSQINEKFKYAQGNIVQVVYIINSNGDTTGSYTTTGTRYKTTHNKFRTIDIPVLVGYELGNGRIHANFNAGVVINAYSWQKGDVLDTAFHPISITTGKSTSPYQFKTNVGIGFMGAVSVYYKLTDKWHIFAEPYFRYNFSPASKSDLTIKQKYNTAGLRLGVRLDF